MAHFAKVENGIVVEVLITNNQMSNEGHDWLVNTYGGTWLQTSYNTRHGIHYTDGVPSADQSKALRKNYAGIGYTYDKDRDAFIPPKPFDSWVLNEETCNWESPVQYPEDGNKYRWNEYIINWELVETEEN